LDSLLHNGLLFPGVKQDDAFAAEIAIAFHWHYHTVRRTSAVVSRFVNDIDPDRSNLLYLKASRVVSNPR
jgi:hypothetical protein